MSDRTGEMDHHQPYAGPANSQREQPQTYKSALLEQQRPEAQHGDHARDFFFAGQGKNYKNKAPQCLADIKKIDGKEQERSRQRLGMEIERESIELCWIRKIEQGERHRSPGGAQAQSRQPEGGKSPARHNKRLKNKQRFRVAPEDIEQRDGEKDRFKVDRETRNASQSITIGIREDITYRLVKERSMQQTPDGLIHYSQVFGIGLKGILSGCLVYDEVDAKRDHGQQNETQANPIGACAGERLWHRIEALAPYKGDLFQQ